MDDKKIVRLREDYFLDTLEGEHTVHHQTLPTSLYLNDSAMVIWRLCDGKRTVADIIDLLTEAYPENRKEIDQSVKELVDVLVNRDIATLI
ncbi:MAG: pyrroloquinoline quinone biosynthesis peptide chaperone PqqD [Desulfofustis sp.]|nr:pyrroloquinoline quinone biosynthesis peptide chaperone PqqD [Desulfofustis sp.]